MQSKLTPTGGPGVIVAGMHRSATSLTTSVLVGCGWKPTGSMIGATAGNKRGHFEDRNIHRLHVDLLRTQGVGWDYAPELRARRAHPLNFGGHECEVQALVGQLRGTQSWVWKNPRATLLLDEWGRVLPDAQVVICVRSPAGVMDSLLRRNDRLRVAQKGWLRRARRTLRALSLWRSYNLAAFTFARRHPDRVVVVRIPEDLAMLAAATTPSLFEPELLSQQPRRKLRLMAALAPRSQLLYHRLLRLHDSTRLAAVLAGPPESW
jgi:hypothetical protein